jgi:hypothetical protein
MLMWVVLGVALGGGTVAAAAWAWYWQAAPNRPAPPRHISEADPCLVGTPSCSARPCHGGVEPADGRLRRDEYTTWVRRDPHAAAYRALLGDRARQIMSNLASAGDGAPAHRDGRCLGCHSVPRAGGVEGLAWMRPDGVGCEACHGPARGWLDDHTAPARWARWTPADKAEAGLTPLGNPAAVARTCVGCHVGAPPDRSRGVPARFVGHDLLAAGHPRLNFEFVTYLANLPPHWNPSPRGGPPEPEYSVRAWSLGQLVSARAALEVLAYRAAAWAGGGLRDGTWPDLAEYDCFACHHALRQPSWRQVPPGSTGRGPGRWSWGNWYFALLPLVPEGDPAEQKALTQLRELLEQPYPDAKLAGSEVQKVGAMLQAWEGRLARRGPEDPTLPGLLDRLSRGDHSAVAGTWDLAGQMLLAASVLENARVAGGRAPAKPEQRREMIQWLFGKLAYPLGMDSPSAFEWDATFDERLRSLLRDLCQGQP